MRVIERFRTEAEAKAFVFGLQDSAGPFPHLNDTGKEWVVNIEIGAGDREGMDEDDYPEAA